MNKDQIKMLIEEVLANYELTVGPDDVNPLVAAHPLVKALTERVKALEAQVAALTPPVAPKTERVNAIAAAHERVKLKVRVGAKKGGS